MRKIYTSAMAYTLLGLVGGVYYRELTKAQHFTGTTQLAFLHTHLLALGMLFFLVVLALEKAFTLTASPRFALFFYSYHAGLLLTVTMLVVHGTMTVFGHRTGAAISGMAGLGHIGLATGLAFFFLTLKDRLDAEPGAESPAGAKSPAGAGTAGAGPAGAAGSGRP